MNLVKKAGTVLRAAVIPEGNRILPPAKAAMKLRCRNMIVEHFEDCAAFVLIEPFNSCGEILVHEKRFPARHRVGAHNWVQRFRKSILAIAQLAGCPETVSVDLCGFVPSF